MTDPLTPEEEVIREWVAAMTMESGAPLPPSLRNAEPLPRRRVLPVIVTLLEIIDDLRAALPVPAGDEWIDLAADIRAVDGNHDTGAGALAEALTARGWTRRPAPAGPTLLDISA